jgi:hypothetical protein
VSIGPLAPPGGGGGEVGQQPRVGLPDHRRAGRRRRDYKIAFRKKALADIGEPAGETGGLAVVSGGPVQLAATGLGGLEGHLVAEPFEQRHDGRAGVGETARR